ncbi:MAG: hypothetical protein QM564_00070 [Bergeyella sp.]
MKNKIITALSALVVGLAGYLIYDNLNQGMSKAEMKSQINDLKSDYEFIQKDLEMNLSSLNISNKLIFAQKQKIENILKKSEITEVELEEAKRLMRSISQGVLEEYKNNVKFLEAEKQKLTMEGEANEILLEDLNGKIKHLEMLKSEVNTKYIYEKGESDKKTKLLGYASSLSLSNFTLQGVKVKNSGREIETDKASRVNRLDVSFDINENKIAESGTKEFFLVVFAPDGKLATFQNGTTGAFMLNDSKIQYSDKVSFDYTNGEVKTINFEWKNEDFQKGNYVIEVYENNPKKITKIGGAIKKLE